MNRAWRERVFRTFGFRLAAWYFVLFIVSTATIIGLTYLLLAQSLEQRDRQVIASTLTRYLSEYRTGGLEALDRAIARDRAAGRYEPLFVRVLGPDQAAVYFAAPTAWEAFDFRQLTRPPLLGTETWSELSAPGADERLEVASVRLANGTLFQVGKSTGSRQELLQRYREVALLGLVGAIAIGLAGGLAVTRPALQPLRDIAQTVRAIMRTGDVRARVSVAQTGDAVDELGTLFNAMLARIEGLIAAMRDSLDNVAHDLRTPMTRLRAVAESALDRPREAEAYREALVDCVEESERVVTMLDTLMDVSEAETGTLRLQLEELEVADLVARAVELYADLAEEKRVRLENTVPAGLTVRADATRMRRVIANLLDNALKYTPPGGSVEVRAAPVGEGVALTVADNGVGIDLEDLPRIWDRLYRADRSRSARGLGLGLSLVKAIVEAHGGRAVVASEPGRGSRFTIVLPTARATSAAPSVVT